MYKTAYTLMILVLLVVTGCAQANQRPQTPVKSALEQLEQENETLKAELETLKGSHPTLVAEPAPLLPNGMARPVGPWPAHVFQMYKPVPGCHPGLRVEITNQLKYHVRLMLDGAAVAVIGRTGNLQMVPPGKTVHGCIDHPGTHNLSGELYALSVSAPAQKVDVFSLDKRMGGRLDGSHTIIFIDERLAYFN